MDHTAGPGWAGIVKFWAKLYPNVPLRYVTYLPLCVFMSACMLLEIQKHVCIKLKTLMKYDMSGHPISTSQQNMCSGQTGNLDSVFRSNASNEW